MEQASPMAYLGKRFRVISGQSSDSEDDGRDLNITVVTFEKMKEAEANLAGGDPYSCQDCGAIVNKYSEIILESQALQTGHELHTNQALWLCEFCGKKNLLRMEKEEIPKKDDLVYMLEGVVEKEGTKLDSTLVFCIDVSGSMNSTSNIEGKVDMKYGISQEEIDMLKQFMEEGDEAQLNFFPGAHNKNKTFVSRKQCILSAIEAQLHEISKSDPQKRVGFVTFNNEVTVVGDSKSATVNILGDKLLHKNQIVESLNGFKLTDPITDSHKTLLETLHKTEAKGQTALGPALVSAIEVAAKGSLGSSVFLCTDGLANIGIGQLEPLTEEGTKFYQDLGQFAKNRNITVSIMTIKGEGCKMEVIGKMAELSNGNTKVVNPERLSEDFANVLKDEVVGLNVVVKIMLHRALRFRNQSEQFLSEGKRILRKEFANATKNTRLSFEYEARSPEELKEAGIDISAMKKVPFQVQISYISPKGGRFLRVVSLQSETTTEKKEMLKKANLGVVHQRVTAQTAAIYSKGEYKGSRDFNSRWEQYLSKNFQDTKYQEQNEKFAQKNQRLNKAIKHKERKRAKEAIEEQMESEMVLSLNNSDEDAMELMDNLRERQEYSVSKRMERIMSSEGKKSVHSSLERGQSGSKPLRSQSPKSNKKSQERSLPKKERRRRSIVEINKATKPLKKMPNLSSSESDSC